MMNYYLSEGTQVIGPLNANDVLQYSALKDSMQAYGRYVTRAINGNHWP